MTINAQYSLSQQTMKGQFNLGFEGGVQFSNVEDARTLNPAGSKTAYSLGPYIEYFISDIFTVKMGLYFDNEEQTLGSRRI